MKYSDMHTHGDYSDGKGAFAEFIDYARTKGLSSLGFSDHSPVPLENGWSMKLESLASYLNDLAKIKKNSSGEPDIYTGLELDYIPGIDVREYIGFSNLPLDYFLGSVHYIYSMKLGMYLTVDGPPETFEYLVKEGFGNDGEAVYKSYYSNVREMIETYKPAVIAHIDLVTKNNLKTGYFDAESTEYISEINRTLDVAKTHGSIIEINTGGMSRGYMDRPYPSEYILYMCLEKGIPVALNSDAHSPVSLTYGFDDATASLRKMGFNEIMTYQKGNWAPVQL